LFGEWYESKCGEAPQIVHRRLEPPNVYKPFLSFWVIDDPMTLVSAIRVREQMEEPSYYLELLTPRPYRQSVRLLRMIKKLDAKRAG
jgi:hypothetical protein